MTRWGDDFSVGSKGMEDTQEQMCWALAGLRWMEGDSWMALHPFAITQIVNCFTGEIFGQRGVGRRVVVPYNLAVCVPIIG